LTKLLNTESIGRFTTAHKPAFRPDRIIPLQK
jgi:hypothetical protein